LKINPDFEPAIKEKKRFCPYLKNSPIFNYKNYMNRYIYWLLVFVIIIAILIPGTALFPPVSGNIPFNYSLIIFAIIICICLAYTKIKKLEMIIPPN
jgi:uncharacterized membrane protein YoaK (UPF0700 family)